MPTKALHRLLMVSVAVVAIMGVVAFVLSGYMARPASAATQEIDPSYANDTTVYMIGPHLITNPDPSLFATAVPLYIAAYQWDGVTPPTFQAHYPPMSRTTYTPQCDPCYHPGLPTAFVYHDHILSGAPKFGVDGTAGSYKGPWKVIVMLYNASVEADANFQPFTNDEALDAAVQKELAAPSGPDRFTPFLPINADLQHGSNPYEFVTGNVLICPLVSSHA